jgi:hypothetical protein
MARRSKDGTRASRKSVRQECDDRVGSLEYLMDQNFPVRYGRDTGTGERIVGRYQRLKISGNVRIYDILRKGTGEIVE